MTRRGDTRAVKDFFLPEKTEQDYRDGLPASGRCRRSRRM